MQLILFLLLVVMLDRPCSEAEWQSTGYPLNSPVSPSTPLPCVCMCHFLQMHCTCLGDSEIRCIV